TFQQQPPDLTISAVINRIHKLIVIFIAHRPFHAYRLSVANGIGLWIKSLAGFKVRRTGRRLIASSRDDVDVIKFRRDVLWQIIQSDALNARSGISRVQDGLPLNEAGG